MKEIATVIPEDEFRQFLEELQDEVRVWKEVDGLGYISILCQLAKTLTTTAGTDYDILSGVKLSNEKLDLIDKEILHNFTGTKNQK